MERQQIMGVVYSKRSALMGVRVEEPEMAACIAFIAYMSSKQKNQAIQKSYMYATTGYRRELKANTPTSKYPSKGKKPLKNTVGVIPSKKYAKKFNLTDPIWVGHLVKKGAYHQHLVVRGTKAWKQDGSPLQRSKNGTRIRKDTFSFRNKNGFVVRGTEKKAVAGNDYVSPIASKWKNPMLAGFSKSFIAAMHKESLSAKYKGVFR